MFNGQNISSTALEIIETATQIVNSTFKFNRKGKLIKINESYTIEEIANTSIQFNGSFAGGAIIATGCEINISQSTFENNGAE